MYMHYQNTKKNTFPLHFLNFYTKRVYQRDKKNFWQNTVCLEHQIYASQKKITQPLVVMVETFRMSGVWCLVSGVWCQALDGDGRRRKSLIKMMTAHYNHFVSAFLIVSTGKPENMYKWV